MKMPTIEELKKLLKNNLTIENCIKLTFRQSEVSNSIYVDIKKNECTLLRVRVSDHLNTYPERGIMTLFIGKHTKKEKVLNFFKARISQVHKKDYFNLLEGVVI